MRSIVYGFIKQQNNGYYKLLSNHKAILRHKKAFALIILA